MYFSSLAGLPCWRSKVGPVRTNVPLSGDKDPVGCSTTAAAAADHENDNGDDDESNDDENADAGTNIYNYNVHIVQHQKNQMIGLANGSSGGGGNASGGEESEPEVSRVTVGTRLNLDVAGGETIFLCGKWKHVKNSKF